MASKRSKKGAKEPPKEPELLRIEWLNYHHLLYFWSVARLGSVTAASKELRLAQPTISGQIRTLEEALDEKLFRRAGRRLELTEAGRLAFRYADDIFSLGREMLDTLRGRPTGRPTKLHVGISDAMPKNISHAILAPALTLEHPVQLVCIEDKSERLLTELAQSGLDLVLADRPIAGQAPVNAFNHPLGQCGVSFLGAPRLADPLRDGFPGSLDGAPLLLPSPTTALRRRLDQWFSRQGIEPRIVGEFDDSALIKVFARSGSGLFAAPSLVEHEVCDEFDVIAAGRTDQVIERFYIITIERKIENPAVAEVTARARSILFGSPKS